MSGPNILLSGEMERSIPTLIVQAGPVAKGVLLVLLLFSIISWAIILQKTYRFRLLTRAARSFWKDYAGSNLLESVRCAVSSRRYGGTPFRTLILVGLYEGHGRDVVDGNPDAMETVGGLPAVRRERIERAMERSALAELALLERHLPFLATTANVSPFLGLFGTVWGVMSAFLAMGVKGSASLSVVGPGIAEALITTVAGLASAIPAVIAYNYFLGRIRRLSIDLERLRSSFADRMTREETDGAP